jgi:hypothetical protein
VYRSQGLDDNVTFERISTAPLTDTVFRDVGINTLDFPFVFKIELYVPSLTQLPVDTSSAASSVRLSTLSQPASIQLTWDAHTPWYNYTQALPYHLIYRGIDSGELTLIDSVNVNEFGFTYTDTGQSPAGPLLSDATYYYQVTTRGAYGNPNIPEPLLNDSQVDGNVLLDTIPPCPPVATLQDIDCKSFSCTGKEYFNTITWKGSGGCADDVVAYKIYGREVSGTDFQLLATVTEQTYTQWNLRSRAKCYQITAVDYAGNESIPGALVCSDNCPYFELPNVITPGKKDELNDFFMAFSGHSSDTTKCARFVMAVDVTIYDRWGTEVYSGKSQENADPFILWDGHGPGGQVPSGVYFYKADVLFDVVDPGKRHKQLKGWVKVQ